MRAGVLLALLAALALAGCTDAADAPDELQDPADPADPEDPGAPVDGGDEGPVAGALEVDIDAAGTYPFNPVLEPARIEVAAGTELTVHFTNRDNNPFVGHDVHFSGVEEGTAVLNNGGSESITFVVDLAPGEYPYWCTVGNHRDQGMEGVLVVV